MNIQGKHYQTIWLKGGNPEIVQVIDQWKFPFQFDFFELKTIEDAFYAIKEMVLRGAPLIWCYCGLRNLPCSFKI